ncbi:MAG: polyprenyl synthetase family protein [Promethearchaeota archaeon]
MLRVTLREALAAYKREVDAELRRIFDRKVAAAGHPALATFYERVKEYVAPVGGEAKRVRPLLVKLGAESLPSTCPDEVVVLSVACAVELLHNASLFHDDVIDDHEVRRGRPTFHAVYSTEYADRARAGEVPERPGRAEELGRNLGILGGDQVFFAGLELLWKLPVDPETKVSLVKAYQQAFNGVVEGVVLEEHLEDSPSVSLEEYLHVARFKTAHLLVKSAEMGAVLAGAQEDLLEGLRRFVEAVGVAFQVKDDVLGTFGDARHKPTDSDVREGKKTVLLAIALEKATVSQREVIERVVGNQAATSDDVQRVREVFEQCGALSGAGDLLEKLARTAAERLDRLKPRLRAETADLLGELARYVVDRTY